MIETLLSYGYGAKTSILQTAQYYHDYPNTCTQNVKDAGGVAVASGYERRRILVQKSQVVPFATALHVDFLTCPRFVILIHIDKRPLIQFLSCRWLPPGISMKMKFIRNDDNFVIIANSGEYRLKLLELYVEFRKISVDIPIMKRELAALEAGEPYKMPFLTSKFFIHTVPKGRRSFMLNDMVTGNLPRQIILCFVRHDSFNADPKKNGYIFENVKISNLVFKVNSENSPPMEYRPDFTATPVNCVREYQHLMNAIGIKRLNTGVGIGIKDFATNCCFWVLDTTPEQCNNAHMHIGLSGNIGVEIGFAAETDAAFQMLGYGVYPVQAIIDKTGNCKVVDNI